jgi:hypothetical protein
MALTQPFKFLLIFLPCCLLTFSSAAQYIITNSAGQRVVIYPDGSWRHAELGDSLLLKKNPYRKANSKPASNNQAMNEGERYEFLLRRWNDLYAAINTEKIEAQKKFRDDTNAKFKASEEYQSAEANKKLIDPVRFDQLEEAFTQSVRNLKHSKQQQKNIKKLLEKADKVNLFLSKLTDKKVDKTRTQFNQYLETYEPQRSLKPQPSTKTKKKSKSAPITTSSKALKTNTDLMPMHPEMVNKKPSYYAADPYTAKPYRCTLMTDSMDLLSGRKRMETTPGLLFTYTEPDLRPYFKDKDLIKCRGRLTRLGPYTYLDIEFQIASSHSQSNFGSLPAGSLLRFQLMNEESVSLYNGKANSGRIDPYTGHTIFTGQYPLGRKELKALKKSGLNKMRVMWSTGFEDYDVYYIDFLIHQINCLETGGRK